MNKESKDLFIGLLLVIAGIGLLIGCGFVIKAEWEIAQSYGMSFIEFLLWNGKIVITK